MVLTRPKRYGGLITTMRGAKRARYVPPVRFRAKPKRAVRRKLRTRTRVKVHQKARSLPNRSGSESKYNIFRRPFGLAAKVANKLQDNTYTRNEPSVINAGAGAQNAAQLGTMFNTADINAMMATAFTQLPSSVSHGTCKIFLKSCYSEIMIQNSSNAVARVQIWNTMPKRDVYQDQTPSTLTPLVAWTDGLKIQTSAGTGGEWTVIGSRPTDAKLFNDYYRVGKVTYIDLAPGQVHYHRMHYKIDRFVAEEMINNANLYSLKGVTLGTMIVHYGEPMVDNTGVQTTTSPTQLHVICTKTYHFSWLQNNTSISTNTDNLAKTAGVNLENLVTGASAAFAAVT